MARYKYPSHFNNIWIDWDKMVKYSGSYWNRDGAYYTWLGHMSSADSTIQYKAAQLLRMIGDGIGVEYKCGIDDNGKPKGSSGNLKSLAVWLLINGYNVKTFDVLEANQVEQRIRRGHPVLTSGYGESKLYNTTVGHAWIIDGMTESNSSWDKVLEIREHKSPFTLIATTGPIPESCRIVYHHINWGWGGEGNGYYFPEVFYAIVGLRQDSDYNPETRSGEHMVDFDYILEGYDIYPVF
jgi:hypothetical protein